jgi:hypothetical protein
MEDDNAVLLRYDDPDPEQVAQPLVGIYGTVADARKELRSMPGFLDALPAKRGSGADAGSNTAPQALDDVACLCRLPLTFREGTQSARKLVHKSRTDPKLVTVEAVKAVLDAAPGLIDEWRRWSEDKRTSSGWFLSYENGSHVVGYHPRGDRVAFPDASSACAEFIVRELRSIW